MTRIQADWAMPTRQQYPFIHIVDDRQDRTRCGYRFTDHWADCYPADGPPCSKCEALAEKDAAA